MTSYPTLSGTVVRQRSSRDYDVARTARPRETAEAYPKTWYPSETSSVTHARSERDALYAEFRPLVQRLLRQYGSDQDLRQDLEGEIYYQFCRHLEAFDPERGVPLRPYLVRQLTASIYTYVRCHWRRQRREFSLENWGDATQNNNPSDQWDHSLMVEQIQQSLPEAIARLPQRQRNVVVWRYYEEKSFEEIAEMLGVQVATARSLLRHGLNNLRKNMGAENLFAE